MFQSGSTYASLSGSATIVRDRDRVRALWSESFRPWFPDGPDQRDLALVRVDPQVGEYWDQRGATGLRYLWESAKAVVQGERVDDAAIEGEGHGKVPL